MAKENSKFNNLSDEEIVDLCKAQDKEAINYLLAKYKSDVYMKTTKYYINGAEQEDLYQEETNWFQDTLGEWFSRTFVKFDWRNAYKTFCGYLDSLSTENGNTKTSELKTELQPLRDSVQGLITLVEDFDMSVGFDLANEYTGKSSNVRIEQSGDSSIIYYIDENGAQITLSQLLNCFYTYTGMGITAQLEGFLRASQEGVPFDAEYQMGLLNEVNGMVDSLKDVGAFGVASAQDITTYTL